jgi:hypothetical protein
MRDEFVARRRAAAQVVRRDRLHGVGQRSRDWAPRTLRTARRADLGGMRRGIDTPPRTAGKRACSTRDDRTLLRRPDASR